MKELPIIKLPVLVLSFFLSLAANFSNAQLLHINTTLFIGGDSTHYSEATYAIPTRDKGILFVGFTESWGGRDIPTNPPDTSAETYPSNVLVGKIDSNMNLEWVKVYGGSWSDLGESAVQTPDGGYAVAASTRSNNRDVSGNHQEGTADFWLLRLDSAGNLLWQKCYGSVYNETPFSMALTPDHGFIIAGCSNGSGDDVPHYGPLYDIDWFIVKTDSLGNKQWTKSIGGSRDEDTYGSILSANNAYYLVSCSASIDYDCTDTAWHPGVYTLFDYYIFKLDTAGNTLWDSSYGGSGADYAMSAIWDNRDSSIVISGNSSSYDYMVKGSIGQGDIWVIKTDRNGVLKWETSLGSNYEDELGYGICTAPFGYMICGVTEPSGPIGFMDNWTFAINSEGKAVTNKLFGGINWDQPFAILPFKNGYATVGSTNSQSFTEGKNIGDSYKIDQDVFVTYTEYLPLTVDTINSATEQFIMYPNPAHENVYIKTPAAETGNLLITNIIGQAIYTQQILPYSSAVNINTIGWAKGIYMVQWRAKDGIVLTTKLIID